MPRNFQAHIIWSVTVIRYVKAVNTLRGSFLIFSVKESVAVMESRMGAPCACSYLIAHIRLRSVGQEFLKHKSRHAFGGILDNQI